VLHLMVVLKRDRRLQVKERRYLTLCFYICAARLYAYRFICMYSRFPFPSKAEIRYKYKIAAQC
jgi:hypothetical protein